MSQVAEPLHEGILLHGVDRDQAGILVLTTLHRFRKDHVVLQ